MILYPDQRDDLIQCGPFILLNAIHLRLPDLMCLFQFFYLTVFFIRAKFDQTVPCYAICPLLTYPAQSAGKLVYL